MPAKKLPPTLCPDCFLYQGIDTPIISRQGSSLRCEMGHTWPGNDQFSDFEIFERKQNLARRKREALHPPEEKETDPSKIVAAVIPTTGKEVVISDQDRIRISSIVGEFGDGATLFGSIKSMEMDIKSLQDELNMEKAKKRPSVPGTQDQEQAPGSGGDMPVTVMIPEQFVQAMKDISEANGTTIPDYMQSVIANGFESNWFC